MSLAKLKRKMTSLERKLVAIEALPFLGWFGRRLHLELLLQDVDALIFTIERDETYERRMQRLRTGGDIADQTRRDIAALPLEEQINYCYPDVIKPLKVI